MSSSTPANAAMRIVRREAPLRALVRAARRDGRRIAFVPTMGALHDGHLALVRRARRLGDLVVVSIFVNPLQFGPREDFARYPRDLRRDAALLREAGAGVLFAPDVAEMYPRPMLSTVDVAPLATTLCGPFRPGHFAGVCVVVLKLLHLVEPDVMVMGQKDAQQATILGRMIDDLSVPTRLVVAPTVRERDGLAMSSRNAYLTAEQRAAAPGLYAALQAGAASVERGETSPARVRQTVRRALGRVPGFVVQYAEVVDREDLQTPRRVEAPVLLALAGHFGATRLIDNVVAAPPRPATSGRGRRARVTAASRRHS